VGGALLILTFAATVHADPWTDGPGVTHAHKASTLRAVTYGGGQFVAVGDFGTIITSSDAYHWTNQTYGTFPSLYGVAYARRFICCRWRFGHHLDVLQRSELDSCNIAHNHNLWAIAGNPSASPKLIAVGDQGAAVSSMDGGQLGEGWNSSSTNNLRGVAFDLGRLLRRW